MKFKVNIHFVVSVGVYDVDCLQETMAKRKAKPLTVKKQQEKEKKQEKSNPEKK